jgi:hypothetical protein
VRYIFHKFKAKMTLSFLGIFAVTLILFCNKIVYANNLKYDENVIKAAVEKIYEIRSSAFVSGDVSQIKQYYDTTQIYGKWALEHEIKRVKYLKTWSKQRGIQFKNVDSTIRVKKIYNAGNVIRIALEETYKFDYIYPMDAEETVNSFGVGIRHYLSLKRKGEEWIVYNDWYTDCFEDALASFTGEIPANIITFNKTQNLEKTTYIYNLAKKLYYDREKAIAYADKYCGAAWGSGNNYKYNPRYRDFTGIGGDCTNFASQALGDKEAGGLPFGGGWHCSYSKYGDGQGSHAWVNTDGLKNYLIGSGKGSLIGRGNFKELTTSKGENGIAAVNKLDLADLVSYEKKGNIDHFAVVTGFDSHGYPLVNSHTTDRYHVPWDLGWGDNKIRFLLIHIND